MPKLLSYYKNTPLNVYDSFNPRSLRHATPAAPGGRVFAGSATDPIRDLSRTNVVRHGALVDEGAEARIWNWYARTNIAPHNGEAQRAWDNWAQMTQVLLILGNMPIHSLPLSDLLQRREGQGNDKPPSDAEIAEFANDLHRTFWGGAPGTPCAAPETTEAWLMVARRAWGLPRPPALQRYPCLAHVPVRQSCYVRVQTDARALGRLVESMPTDAAPESLVWIHLEGRRVFNVRHTGA